MSDASRMSIGEVARRTGLSVHALRFYEREGLLLHPVERVGGRRVYDSENVEWLVLCTILRAADMPLSEIRRYTDLAREGPGNEQARLALLREHQHRVADRLATLDGVRQAIDAKIAAYSQGLCTDL